MTGIVSRDDGTIAVVAPIVKRDGARQIAYGVVLEPRSEADPDLQADFYYADDVEKACHGFMARVTKGEGFGDLMHDGVTRAGYPVEIYIAPVDFVLGDQPVVKGSWVMGMHYPDARIWKAIMDGELSAFSISGEGLRD